MTDHLAALIARLDDPPPFALLRRQDGPGVELLLGDIVDVPRLADIPLPDPVPYGGELPQLLALVPYRQIAERGFACHDDGAPLRCLRVRQHAVIAEAAALQVLPRELPRVRADGFDLDDEAYAAIAKRVISDEIGRGEGANFVIRRDFVAALDGAPARTALALFARLLATEPGAYWTFAVHAGDVTMAGATPERHVTLRSEPGDAAATVLMNPISGTYRYPPEGPSADGLLRFLADPKETEELYMVVDEELKMMSEVCQRGGQVLGPYLKQMGHLAHTEYLLAGQTDRDPREVLRETMFAATVTGSPVRNACRVIAAYEPTPRGYYAGSLALFGQDAAGRRTLDAPILLRTLHLAPDGTARLPVAATLVRHSDPAAEAVETRAKAASVLAALGLRPGPARKAGVTLAADPRIADALRRRNDGLARFWLDPQHDRPDPRLAGRRALIVDAEDTWSAMLGHLLRRLGMTVTVTRWDRVAHLDADLLIAGPGPGDPTDADDPRIRGMRDLVVGRLENGAPLLAVCLSHQILARLLGLPVRAKQSPNQGTQREITVFGARARVGFYNTFAAYAETPLSGVEVSADPATGEVHALRGPGYAGVQFHLESILSTEGADLLASVVTDLLE